MEERAMTRLPEFDAPIQFPDEDEPPRPPRPPPPQAVDRPETYDDFWWERPESEEAVPVDDTQSVEEAPVAPTPEEIERGFTEFCPPCQRVGLS